MKDNNTIVSFQFADSQNVMIANSIKPIPFHLQLHKLYLIPCRGDEGGTLLSQHTFTSLSITSEWTLLVFQLLNM